MSTRKHASTVHVQFNVHVYLHLRAYNYVALHVHLHVHVHVHVPYKWSYFGELQWGLKRLPVTRNREGGRLRNVADTWSQWENQSGLNQTGRSSELPAEEGWSEAEFSLHMY